MNGMSLIKRIMRILALVLVLNLLDFSLAQGETLPDFAYIYGMSGHPQGYALSCEARSAVDLAAFWGFSIGETEFMQALPSSDNPDQGYVGSPNEVWGRLPPHGYGVHADPVAETLRDFGLQAEAGHDLSWDDLRGEISLGRPVILWVIGGMWSGKAVDYEASDGSVARVAAYEHTMILTGYNQSSVQVVDAYTGQYQYYALSSFLNSWSVLGDMAVLVSGEGKQQEVSQVDTQDNTYIVQPGDYLVELAQKFGISWQELAATNSISYPFIIYAGQVLQVPSGNNQDAELQLEPESQRANTQKAISEVNFQAYLPEVQWDFSSTPMASNEDASTDEAPVETVVVQHTGTLFDFGRSLGVAWHVLARLNNLPASHILYPGEILRVK